MKKCGFLNPSFWCLTFKWGIFGKRRRGAVMPKSNAFSICKFMNLISEICKVRPSLCALADCASINGYFFAWIILGWLS